MYVFPTIIVALHAGRRVQMDVEDSNAPTPPPSSMRRSDAGAADAASAASALKLRHIAFIEQDLFNDEGHGDKKVFPKEIKVRTKTHLALQVHRFVPSNI